MRSKFLIAAVVVIGAIAFLISSAIDATAKKVVTVSQLVQDNVARSNIRLGARVTDYEFQYQTTPSFRLAFKVRDIVGGEEAIDVVYLGIMPDTLKAGRDVILEGDYADGTFSAKQLMTQCPSKYEVPNGPGADK